MSTTAPTRSSLPPTAACSSAAHSPATTSCSTYDRRHGRLRLSAQLQSPGPCPPQAGTESGRNRLGQRGAPGSRWERVGEVLRLVRHETIGDLHETDRVRRHPVIGDHTLTHPKLATALDPSDREVAFGGMPAALRFDL